MRIHPMFLGLVLITCTDDPQDPNPGGSGELGVGTFTYLCRSEGDFTCGIGQSSASFPKAFALGGRFGLSYAWKSELDHINEPLPVLQPAAPEQLSFTTDTFISLTAGFTAVLAVTGNSKVVDLIHASVRPVDDLRLVDATMLPLLAPLTELVLPVGVVSSVQLVPLDLNDVELSGALDVTWTIDGDTVAIIGAGQGTGRVRVDTLAAGETTLTATLGDKFVSIILTVDESLDPTTGATDEPTVATTGDTLTSGDTTADTDATDTDTTAASSTTDTSGTTTETTGGAL
jgi:hypothetical protein